MEKDNPNQSPLEHSLTLPPKLELRVDLNNRDINSEGAPWWESKLTVAVVTGLFAIVIPATTLIVKHYENEASNQALQQEYQLEKERLKEKFFLETTENIIGKLTQPELSDEAKMALYTFLGDVSEEGSGTATFAHNMRERTLKRLSRKLAEENAALAEKQALLASYSVGDAQNETQNNQASNAQQETTLAVEKVKSLQDILLTYDTEVKKSNKVTETKVQTWNEIEREQQYWLQGKLGAEVSFQLYESKPSVFGRFGAQVGVIEDGDAFIVKDKYVTVRGYKWLQVQLTNRELSGWYSWENIRSELILKSE